MLTQQEKRRLQDMREAMQLYKHLGNIWRELRTTPHTNETYMMRIGRAYLKAGKRVDRRYKKAA